MTNEEVDVLVAIHIMGYTTHPSQLVNYNMRTNRYDPSPDLVWVTPEGLGAGYAPKRYSTDIGAAWQVVEHFKKPLWIFTLYSSHDTYTADFAEWEDETALGDKRKGTARSRIASRAICLAALRAVGVGV